MPAAASGLARRDRFRPNVVNRPGFGKQRGFGCRRIAGRQRPGSLPVGCPLVHFSHWGCSPFERDGAELAQARRAAVGTARRAAREPGPVCDLPHRRTAASPTPLAHAESPVRRGSSASPAVFRPRDIADTRPRA